MLAPIFRVCFTNMSLSPCHIKTNLRLDQSRACTAPTGVCACNNRRCSFKAHDMTARQIEKQRLPPQFFLFESSHPLPPRLPYIYSSEELRFEADRVKSVLRNAPSNFSRMVQQKRHFPRPVCWKNHPTTRFALKDTHTHTRRF